MELKNCQIFTPTETVKMMLDLIGYQSNVFGKTIIDNSCGYGNFLVEIARRFITDAISNSISKRRIKNALQKDLEKNLRCTNDAIKLYRIREGLPILNDYSIDYFIQSHQKDYYNYNPICLQNYSCNTKQHRERT